MVRHITKEAHKGFLVRSSIAPFKTGDTIIIHSRIGADTISNKRFVLVKFLCNTHSSTRVLVLKELLAKKVQAPNA